MNDKIITSSGGIAHSIHDRLFPAAKPKRLEMTNLDMPSMSPDLEKMQRMGRLHRGPVQTPVIRTFTSGGVGHSIHDSAAKPTRMENEAPDSDLAKAQLTGRVSHGAVADLKGRLATAAEPTAPTPRCR